VEPVRNFRLVAANFYSNGVGRYIANTNIPDFIVNPNFSMTAVKSWSGIYGPEIQASPKTLIYGYYSIAQADQTLATDTSGSVIGYGVNASQTPNHKIQEDTVGLTQTFFRDAKIGGMQMMVQFAHLQRNPFSVPANTPASAKLNMLYFNVRYILP
jgi:hypothetical protein